MGAFPQELYDAIYRNPVWAHDLLQNLSDPDYLSVNFSSHEAGTRAEVQFMEGKKIIVCYYYFDSKGFLQKMEMLENERLTMCYDRLAEIVVLLNKCNMLDRFSEVKELLSA